MKGIWKKRVLALVTALCLVLPMGMTASAAGGFDDLRRSHWAYDEILDVVDKGLFLGTGKDTFGPEVEMSRAMFVTVLARLARAEVDDSKKSDFDDVAKNTWYTGAVNWAAKNGIVKGVSKDDFAPDRVITREEMATMIVRYTDYWDITLPKDEKEIKFSDWRSISDFADEAVTACQRAGLLKGVGENRFDPKGTATRAQVATLISRLSDMEGTMVYVVSFDSNGGTDVDDQYVIDGKKAAKPSGVRRSGYTLVGWYTNEKLTKTYSFSTKVTEDITLYAKWTRNSSSGGSSTTYYNPETAEKADVEQAIKNVSAFSGIQLTYPKMTMSGNEIQLSGVYTAGQDHRSAFTGVAYEGDGYVVPILLTAPSSYSGGDVTLTVTKDVADVTKTIKQNELDGEYYFYLLKYIPKEPPVNWAPVITVNWNGSSVTYTLNVAGMKEAVDDTTVAKIKELKPSDVSLTGEFAQLIPTYPDVTVARTETEGTYDVYLSGGFTPQENLPGFSEKNGYVVPIKLTAPNDYAGPVKVTAEGGIAVKPLPAGTVGVSEVTVLVYLPASLGSGATPVLKAEWTKVVAPLNWLDLLEETPDKTTLTYKLNVDGMRPIRSGGTPYVPTAAEQEASATKYPSNAPFLGISKFTAKTEFSAPTVSGGVTTITVNVEAPALIEGTAIPGFGTVGTVEVPLTSFIFPIAFHEPDYVNLGALGDGDKAVEYCIYPAGGPKAEAKIKTKAEIEDPFLLWKLVTPENLEALKTNGLRVDFAWFGGFTESFIFKLGTVTQQGGITAQDPVSGNATMAEATKNESDPFHGLETAVAQVKVEKQDEKFVISGTYAPWTQDQEVPGFGLAGDEKVPLGGCVVPLAFPKPQGMDLSRLTAGTVAQTVKVSWMENGEPASREFSITKEALEAENPFHYYRLVKDPAKAKGTELNFEIVWYNGFKESYTFVFGDLIPSNAEGEKFNLNDSEKKAIQTAEGSLKNIPINQVAIAAQTAEKKTVLRLTARDQALNADQIIPYYGQGYGPGYIVALNFTAPAGATKVTQNIKNGYTGAEQKKENISLNGDKTHTILMYIPKEAKDSTYAPVIELIWSNDSGMSKTETFALDVKGMGVTIPAPPAPVAPELTPAPEPAPETEPVETQQEEPSFWDLFRK